MDTKETQEIEEVSQEPEIKQESINDVTPETPQELMDHIMSFIDPKALQGSIMTVGTGENNDVVEKAINKRKGE